MMNIVSGRVTELDGIRVVQDEEEAAKALANGETVCRFEYGDSMHPILRHGEYAKLTPVTDKSQVKRGDAVFCRMPPFKGEGMSEGYLMTHMVWEISDCGHDGELWFKIGSTSTSIYGWTKDILAIATGMNYADEGILAEPEGIVERV